MSTDYERGLRDAMTIVDRAIRPLGVPPGGTDSAWNTGYRRAKEQAIAALGAACPAAQPAPERGIRFVVRRDKLISRVDRVIVTMGWIEFFTLWLLTTVGLLAVISVVLGRVVAA